MNWELGTCVIALVTLLVTVSGVIFLGGKIVQRVDDTAKRTDKHEELLEQHGVRINGHDVAITRLDSWNKGYEAAASTGGVKRPF